MFLKILHETTLHTILTFWAIRFSIILSFAALRFLQIKIYLAFLTAYITKIFLMNKLFFCRFIFYDVGVKSYIFCD